jgi:DNA-binding XRE family transcriptional regulator
MPRRKIGKVLDGDEQAPAPAPSILSRAFAVNLRRIRGEMERRQLAKAAGVSERHIWLIETKPDQVNLTLRTVEALARELAQDPLAMLTPPKSRR